MNRHFIPSANVYVNLDEVCQISGFEQDDGFGFSYQIRGDGRHWEYCTNNELSDEYMGNGFEFNREKYDKVFQQCLDDYNQFIEAWRKRDE